MAIYVTRWFARWANQQGLPDEALCRAVHEMSKGLYDVDAPDVDAFRKWANELADMPCHKLIEAQERGALIRVDHDA